MGLAASQARLLSITQRMSDNELRAQMINNQKMRLSAESSQVSENYINALNKTNLMFSNYDADDNKQNIPLTFNSLTAFNQYNNQYGLTNTSGQILISETEAERYRKCEGDLDKFLNEHDLYYTTSYWNTVEDQMASYNAAQDFDYNKFPYTAEELRKMFEGDAFKSSGNISKFSTTLKSEDYINFEGYLTQFADIAGRLSRQTMEYNNAVTKFLNRLYDASGLKATVDGLTTGNLGNDGTGYGLDPGKLSAIQTTLNTYIHTYFNDSSSINISLQNYAPSNNVPSGEYYLYNDPKPFEIGPSLAFGTSCELKNVNPYDGDKYPVTSGKVVGIYDENAQIVEFSSGKTYVRYPGEDFTEDSSSVSSPVWVDVSSYNPLSGKCDLCYWDGTGMTTVPGSSGTKAVKIGNSFAIIESQDDEGTSPQKRSYEFDLGATGIATGIQDPHVFVNADMMLDIIKNDLEDLINQILKNVIDEYGKNPNAGAVAYLIHDPDFTSKDAEIVKGGNPSVGASDNVTELMEKIRECAGLTTAELPNDVLKVYKFLAYIASGEYHAHMIDNGDGTYSIPKSLMGLKADEIPTFIGNRSNWYTFKPGFEDILEAYILNYVMDIFGEPLYGYLKKIGGTDENPIYEDGSAEAKWYTNLFEKIQDSGYQMVPNGLANSKDWIQFALENGIVTMTQVDSEDVWQGITHTSCSDILEQTDSNAAALAEAEYNKAMRQIEAKDELFDLELKNIDTEHSALQNEYESVKKAMSGNIERTFQMYG